VAATAKTPRFGVQITADTDCGTPSFAVLFRGSAEIADGPFGYRLVGCRLALSVNIIIHPATRKQLGTDFDRAIADLRYGGIGINAWVGAAFLLPRAAWGAYPGHTYTDVQSGIGVVHNALIFNKPLKTVVSAPFRPFPRSVLHGEPTLVPHQQDIRGHRAELTQFAADPSPAKLPAIVASALKS
jgi:hypothetical protein